MSLSKLHVRFIQSQKKFSLRSSDNAKETSFPITSLYVKDNKSFYLVIKNESISNSEEMQLSFKEKTPALNSLNCKVKADALASTSEEYEDALLFFNIEPTEVRQLFLLSLQSLSDH